MTDKKKKSDRTLNKRLLRRAAEEMLESKKDTPPEAAVNDLPKLLHELEVHQAELEIQNEELRAAQKKLEKSRDRYTDVYDFAPVGYFTFDDKGTILEANLTGAGLLGVERNRLIKYPFTLFVHTNNSGIFFSHLKQVLESGSQRTCELRLKKKGGPLFFARLESIMVPGGPGNHNFCRTAISDITVQKQTEDALHKAKDELETRVEERTAELAKSNEELENKIAQQKQTGIKLQEASSYSRNLIEASLDPMVTISRGGKITDANMAAERMTGVSRQTLIGSDFSDYFTEPDRAKEGYKKVFVEGYVKDFPLEVRGTSGHITPVLYNATVYKNEAGEVQGVFAAARDITILKETEKRNSLITHLLELFSKKTSRKEYLDSVVELIHDWTGCRHIGIRVVNEEKYIPYTSYVGFNEEFMRQENMLSLDSDSCACIRAIAGKFEPQDASAVTPGGSFLLNNSAEFANRLTAKKMDRFRGRCIRSGYTSIVIIPIRYHDQPLGAIHLADERQSLVPLNTVQFLESVAAPLIGEAIYRFAAEEELEKHRRNLEDLVKERTTQLGSANEELEEEIAARKRTEETLRHSEEYFRLLTENSSDIIAILDADGIIRYISPSVKRALGYTRKELIGKSGFEFVHPADLPGVKTVFDQAIPTPDYSSKLDVRYMHKDGSWLFFEVIGKNLLYNPTVSGIVINSRDITERKKAEEELHQLTEELKRSNADLQQFAYAASHDLQEPLRVVAGFVKLLEKRYKSRLDEKADEYIEFTVEGVKRMQLLIKDLLTYSQVETKGKTFGPAICSVALEQALYNLHFAIEESSAEVTYDLLPTVNGDLSQLTSLFQNLIGNAIKFRSEKKLKIHISAERRGAEWIFSVRDNGIGIDPKYAERIFVIFQRLHSRDEYAGTGIGLSICKKIVERHGGRIWVESEAGKGSIFYFTIPLKD